ncbi:MAG: alanine racemase, partial [Hyphomicrobiales bacterium]
SHFIEGEVEHSPHTARQIAAFNAARALFPGTRASLANSSAIFMDGKVRHDIVRPGYALYGGNPLAGRPNPMRPVIRWQAPIIQTSFVNPGETIGYNATWSAQRPTRIATINLGYADGYPRAASSSDTTEGGFATFAGRQCPFLGRISMDLTVIDITDIPANTIQRGTLVDLVGPDLPLDQVASAAKTIGYELLTHLGRRVHRRILVES